MQDYRYYILDRITQNIAQNPEKTFCRIDGVSLSYKELDRDSDKIVNYILANKKATASKSLRVGIILPRNSNFVAVIFACLKLGATYIPMDTSFGKERIDFITSDCCLDIIIREQELNEAMNSNIAEAIQTPSCEHSTTAYIIYTSGSTGTPKGVVVSYKALYNLLQSVGDKDNINIHPNSVILQFASMCFDPSVLEIFSSLYYGATLVIAQDADRRNANILYQLILSEKVTYASIPAPLLSAFHSFDMPHLETLAVGGDAITYNLTSRIAGLQPYRFVNVYGPTETCVQVTLNEVSDKDDWHSIGRPTRNVVCHVVNDEGVEVAPGEEGELLIGGPQVAEGYINQPDRTSEVFTLNPFNENDDTSPILYHSGDYVRLCHDGSFDFVGRKDSLVKLRGFRIEISEIRNRLEMHERVSAAYVRIETLGNDRYIAAYIQTTDNDPRITDIKEYLSWHVNSYMMPTFWNHVTSFPQTINGKIDHSKLINNAWLKCQQDSTDANNDEFVMANEVADIIGIKTVNIDIDLIDELGITSILAMQIPERMRQHGINITLETVYKWKTIRNICAHQGRKMSYWYNDPEGDTTKPVIVVICGNASFTKLFSVWAEALADDFSIYVIDNYHDYLQLIPTDTDNLVDAYINWELRNISSKYKIAAYTGYCIGGDQALYTAHLLHGDKDSKPVVIPIESYMVPKKYDETLYIPLNFPNLPARVNYIRNEIDKRLMRTMPDFHYAGRVMPVVGDTFNEQQTVLPEQMADVTEQQMQWAHYIFDNRLNAWHTAYPDCEIHVLPATHYSMMFRQESLNPLIDLFKSLLHH